MIMTKEEAENLNSADGNPDTIAEHLRGMMADGTTQCPLCGETWIHTHSPREIVIYRNGIKYGRSLAAPNEPAKGRAESASSD